MSESNLRAALDVNLNSIVDGLPIAWENRNYTQTDDAYLSQFLLPAETIAVGVERGGSDVLAGIYQVMVNIPEGLGKHEALIETQKVKDQFPRSSTLEYNGTRVVIQKVWSNSALIDENFYRVPISIRYRAMS